MDSFREFIKTASYEDFRNLEGYISLERSRRNAFYKIGRIFDYPVGGENEKTAEYIVLTRANRGSHTYVTIMPIEHGYTQGQTTTELSTESLPIPAHPELEEPEVSIELTVDDSTKTAGPPAEAA